MKIETAIVGVGVIGMMVLLGTLVLSLHSMKQESRTTEYGPSYIRVTGVNHKWLHCWTCEGLNGKITCEKIEGCVPLP